MLPAGLIAPLTCEWSAFATPIAGSGTTMVGAVTVIHEENRPFLTLFAQDLDRIRVAQRMYDAGIGRIRRIAAGKVSEVETLSLAEAVGRRVA